MVDGLGPPLTGRVADGRAIGPAGGASSTSDAPVWTPDLPTKSTRLLYFDGRDREGDCHQHVWPAALVEALRRRRVAPYLDGWTLHLDGEPPYEVDAADHDVELRAKQDRADGVGLTLLSLSSPLASSTCPPTTPTRWSRPGTRRRRTSPPTTGGGPPRCSVRPTWPASRAPSPARTWSVCRSPRPRWPTPGRWSAWPRAGRGRGRRAAGDGAPGARGPRAAVVPGWWPALTSYPPSRRRRGSRGTPWAARCCRG